MRTELFDDVLTNKVMTFEEVKEVYAESNNSDLPIDDDTMYLIIMENLIQNGGNIRLMNESDDDILKWCNDYSEYNEADRYLSQTERDASVKDIYESIACKSDYLYKEIIRELTRDKDDMEESKELLKRLQKFC